MAGSLLSEIAGREAAKLVIDERQHAFPRALVAAAPRDQELGCGTAFGRFLDVQWVRDSNTAPCVHR